MEKRNRWLSTPGIRAADLDPELCARIAPRSGGAALPAAAVRCRRPVATSSAGASGRISPSSNCGDRHRDHRLEFAPKLRALTFP
jgi:hypothetical protein